MNYNYLYHLPVKRKMIPFFTLTIFSIFIILATYLKGYDSYNTYGYFVSGHLLVDIPVDSDVMKKDTFLKIAEKKYAFEVVDISNLKVEGIINYQTYYLDIQKEMHENEVVQITFYYNKERIIKKIIRIIF